MAIPVHHGVRKSFGQPHPEVHVEATRATLGTHAPAQHVVDGTRNGLDVARDLEYEIFTSRISHDRARSKAFERLVFVIGNPE